MIPLTSMMTVHTYMVRNSSSFLPLFLPPKKPLTMTAGIVSPAAHHA